MILKNPVKNIDLQQRVFAASPEDFDSLAMELFLYQHEYNPLYRQYCDTLHTDPANIHRPEDIPFLPISFFKTHKVVTDDFEPEAFFESSGTTQSINSKHWIRDLSLYRESFTRGFEKFYGAAEGKCIIGLLPSYLERQHSSLVMMVDQLIKDSHNPLSGFYLYDHEMLHRTLLHNEILKKDTLLIGVTYALLDFADEFSMRLRHTIVMETGGMKGRREEMTRQQVHAELQEKLGLNLVHSEYGMTELLSQAYSKGDGIFHCPNWMKVLLRQEDDPFDVRRVDQQSTRALNGVINVIDLANIYSCAFIATDDMGRLYSNGSFEVLGRMDNSDVRGCSLLVL